MEYKIKVIGDDEKFIKDIYEITFNHVSFPNIKSIAEMLVVSLEENIYPIEALLIDVDTSITYRFYFTRKLAKTWVDKLIPCDKAGMGLFIRGVKWD